MTEPTDPPGPGAPRPDPAATASAAAAPTAAARPSVWTRRWLPYPVMVIAGLLVGFGYGVHNVRAADLGADQAIGAWRTGRDFATADRGALTRAIVAHRGLLALPATEARYYTAHIDDGGRPLVSNCSYRLTGGRLSAQFWTVTLYDDDGYLVPKDAKLFSAGNMTMAPAEQVRWTVLVSPDQQPGRWLPTGGGTAPFALTLRAYLPADGGKGNFTAAELPSIRRETCK